MVEVAAKTGLYKKLSEPNGEALNFSVNRFRFIMDDTMDMVTLTRYLIFVIKK